MPTAQPVYFRTWFVRLDVEHATADRRQRAADAVRQALTALADEAPDEVPLTTRVGLPLDDHAEAAWDLCLLMTFTDETHAARCSAFDGRLAQLLERTPGAIARVIKAWNFCARECVEAR